MKKNKTKTKKKVETKTETKTCGKCYGFGFWPMGDLCPIGGLDSQEWGDKTIACPWCNAGFVKTGERFETLRRIKEQEGK